MASLLFAATIPTSEHTIHRNVNFRPKHHRRTSNFRCSRENPASSPSTDRRNPESENNLLLKLAWYSSELLGIAASIFRSPSSSSSSSSSEGESQGREVELVVDRARVVETIKEDFQRSYFVTGNLTPNAYEANCEFADPAASFKGLQRFKRNCTNFGSLIEKSNMDLIKWEDFPDKGIGHWRFSCILLFPWRPILSATGYTEFYFDPQSGRVCRHVEHWNVPKMALLQQIFRPSRGIWGKRTGE
ncbi:hypothetical protein Syun_013239 [Stephania yunnanensis]|uniref:Uncharacterized protein n=1 Tax=Stephania yunnanensis TaxID=152371 RepID=A0AAP0K1P7_9MAGN